MAPPPAAEPYRLLAGWARTGTVASLAAHHASYGPLPLLSYAGKVGRESLITAVEASGLRGRGGAGFPTGRKLRAVAAGRRTVVIANGCEGEPVSDKDRTLLTFAPHLVLDGAVLAAHAVGAHEIFLCMHRDDPLVNTLTAALAERPSGNPMVRLVQIPHRYVASEESALVHFLNNGDARPTSKPPRPSERGVRGQPTLVDNVETLAHLALIARYGPTWFRGCGTPDSPGSTLLTISGAVARPGVYEVSLGVPLGRALNMADGPQGATQAVLVGGYGGNWLPLPSAAALLLTHRDLAAAGASLGVGSLLVLPTAACGLAETARILRYLAGESAAQCGPCMFGLPAIADDLEHLVRGDPSGDATHRRLRRRLGVITGRGACGHPDGAVRLATSALRTFGTDLREHTAGRPCPKAGHARLPLPALEHRSGGWQ
ncbi:MAG: NADH-ubiquinone oxidoreductase-F iron-sulfur binding region domain-containing protein [Mycobacteriaceae bacterium]